MIWSPPSVHKGDGHQQKMPTMVERLLYHHIQKGNHQSCRLLIDDYPSASAVCPTASIRAAAVCIKIWHWDFTLHSLFICMEMFGLSRFPGPPCLTHVHVHVQILDKLQGGYVIELMRRKK